MCNVCCKEFQGWCKAFTATEVILTLLQAILLTLFVAFLTFLILHFIACSDNDIVIHPDPIAPGTADPAEWNSAYGKTISPSGTSKHELISYSLAKENGIFGATVPPDIACTWTPSAKTKVVTQYFEEVDKSIGSVDVSTTITPPFYDEFQHPVGYDASEYTNKYFSDQFDGEPADNERSFIMALVKMRPPDDITFGCILTIVSEFWTLTAASCVESIEEVDSFESFIMIENYGEPKQGRTHLVANVLIHPQYQGTNKTYDIAALKSEDKLRSKDMLLSLPTMLDYLMNPLGERLTILGFGKFRSINRVAFARGAHAVSVHLLPSALCATHGDAWSARHLADGARIARGRCGTSAVCAGPLFARGAPCNYCPGTPLLQERVLLGLMSDPGPCGAPCEPALYVNLAASRDWLNSVFGGD